MIGFVPLAAIALALSASFGILSGLLTYQEIGEINRKLPDDQQISYLGAPLGKMARIKREYRRLYPDGRVDQWRVITQAIAFSVLAALVLYVFIARVQLPR
jgi:hypothetical protein